MIADLFAKLFASQRPLRERAVGARRARLVSGAVGLALVPAALLGLTWPAQARLARAAGAEAQARADALAAADRVADLPALRREVRQLRAAVGQLRAPQRAGDFPTFLGELAELSERVGLRQYTCTPGDQLAHDGFVEQPVELRFECGFFGMLSFLRQLEASPRLSRVRALHVEARPAARAATANADEATLGVTMTISLFCEPAALPATGGER